MEHEALKNSIEKFDSHLKNIESMLGVSHELKEMRILCERLMSHLLSEQVSTVEHGRAITLLDKLVRGDAEQKELGDHRKMQIVWKFYQTFTHLVAAGLGALFVEIVHHFFSP